MTRVRLSLQRLMYKPLRPVLRPRDHYHQRVRLLRQSRLQLLRLPRLRLSFWLRRIQLPPSQVPGLLRP